MSYDDLHCKVDPKTLQMNHLNMPEYNSRKFDIGKISWPYMTAGCFACLPGVRSLMRDLVS